MKTITHVATTVVTLFLVQCSVFGQTQIQPLRPGLSLVPERNPLDVVIMAAKAAHAATLDQPTIVGTMIGDFRDPVISPDGKKVAMIADGKDDTKTLKVWDIASLTIFAKPLYTLTFSDGFGNASAQFVSGSTLLFRSSRATHVIDTEKKEILWTSKGLSLFIKASDTHVVVSNYKRGLVVTRFSDEQEVVLPDSKGIRKFGVSQGVVAGLSNDGGKQALCTWDPDTGTRKLQYVFRESVSSFRVTPQFVSITLDGMTSIVSVEDAALTSSHEGGSAMHVSTNYALTEVVERISASQLIGTVNARVMRIMGNDGVYALWMDNRLPLAFLYSNAFAIHDGKLRYTVLKGNLGAPNQVFVKELSLKKKEASKKALQTPPT